MGNIIAAVVIVLFLVGLFLLVLRNSNKPERRLMRDFRRLKKLMVSGMKGEPKRRTKDLMNQCEDYLEGLIRVRQQRELLGEMSDTASELTGHGVSPGTNDAVQALDAHVSERLSAFFGELARISTSAQLHQDQALEELTAFTRDLERQREALVDLSRDLGGGRAGERSRSDAELIDAIEQSQATLPEAEVEVEERQEAPERAT